MKIIIDGVEYIATPVGNKCMKEGARIISRRYEECPEFFDTILKRGFAYYERDEDNGFDVWSSDGRDVFVAHDKDIISEWDAKDRCFFETLYPDIHEWNLPEFTEHLKKTNFIYQIDALSATTALLKHGAAYTYVQLNMTGNLTPIMEVKHPVVEQ